VVTLDVSVHDRSQGAFVVLGLWPRYFSNAPARASVLDVTSSK
jgi:hypothetical protein